MFLTNLIVDAALKAGKEVCTSEIHGLSQRGGSVSAGITIGSSVFGFLEKGGVDVLIGLEPLEAERNVEFLHKDSVVIIDENRIFPYSVNSGNSSYPDTTRFVNFLHANIRKVIHLTDDPGLENAVLRNLFVFGRIAGEGELPIPKEIIESEIEKSARKELIRESIGAFQKGFNSAAIPLKNIER